MHDENDRGAPGTPTEDEETLEFVRAVFDAARQGNAAGLAPLLERGLPTTLRNARGDTLLMLACYHGHHDTARLLLERGADPEVRNDAGQSPLQAAAYQGDLTMVRLLLDHGALVDAAGPDGRTALMMAAMFDRNAIVDELLARGADPTVRDAGGAGVVDAARVMGAVSMAARLEALLRART
ncbi:ankyrin repeat domain-containing protein [Deinococcus pimensis]|uniref:ankyrin repeat domain-containing protein n=1 Tax=Deinococcus pimensis TaxID=309888 RepID=UPI00048979B2|nr:ankyrin repeat domain-containing protein [Deinococcus pimensis]